MAPHKALGVRTPVRNLRASGPDLSGVGIVPGRCCGLAERRLQTLARHCCTHDKATVVAAAFDGATTTPALTSLLTWVERTCGSDSVPVTDATIMGPLTGRLAIARATSPAGSAWLPQPKMTSSKTTPTVLSARACMSGTLRIAGSIIG